MMGRSGINPTFRSARCGFTLIEVLIALSVVGVTMTAAFALFSSGLKLRSVTRTRLAFDREARLVASTLRDDLANLVPTGPVPMVSPDAIVLWRRQRQFTVDCGPSETTELVTYQWSGSDFQDSLLVRVAAPLGVDPSDYRLVHNEFMKWARTHESGESVVDYLIRGDHGSRFGDRAVLRGLAGSWVAFPEIGGFDCAFGPTDGYSLSSEPGARVLVNLFSEGRVSPKSGTDTVPGDKKWPTGGSYIAVSYWLPTGAQGPHRLPNPVTEGVQP